MSGERRVQYRTRRKLECTDFEPNRTGYPLIHLSISPTNEELLSPTAVFSIFFRVISFGYLFVLLAAEKTADHKQQEVGTGSIGCLWSISNFTLMSTQQYMCVSNSAN